MSGSPVAVRAGACLLGKWLLPVTALNALCGQGQLTHLVHRGPYLTFQLALCRTQQLRRQNFCSRWTRLWNSLPVQLDNPDIIYGLFRRQLKRHLFQEAWTQRSVTYDMLRLRKTLTHLLTMRILHTIGLDWYRYWVSGIGRYSPVSAGIGYRPILIWVSAPTPVVLSFVYLSQQPTLLQRTPIVSSLYCIFAHIPHIHI